MIMSSLSSSSTSSLRATFVESPTVVFDQTAVTMAAHLQQSQRLFRDDELNKLSMLPPSKCDTNIISDGEYRAC